jgi:para-nitrobenzyl esterase
LGYVFKNLEEPQPKDAELSERMSSYWVNFAKTGDPNGSGLPEWQPFTIAHPKLMAFDGTSGMVPMPDLPRVKALDALFAPRPAAMEPGPKTPESKTGKAQDSPKNSETTE